MIYDNLAQTDRELQAKGFPKKDTPESRSFAVDFIQPASCTYLSIYSDASFDDHESLKAGVRKAYKRMVLFAG